ncbi:translocation/assembly module TamB domain-containing protein [Aestuariibaculum sediminum]|uniref:Translocation/assembly module TamB domain-containing protein n=1 Tax=Aestuariibaculum sediminum TaxID=2770637 RepID=A0A8J6U8V0_9FLAO|nr:translocation/assembly module TamB domain-containing protein [Aestuariibaculum sediminum]MBD0832172.1 translocation/assembly module TamB domain-containing protein [Aestuariibaculum sediminum]
MFIILILVLTIPFVQTQLGNYATKKLNEEFKTNINIDRVSMQINGDIELKDIYIQDYKQDTLISVSELNSSIISFKNLVNGKLAFGDIDLEGLVFNIVTYKDEPETNLDVFVRRFEDDNPRTEKSNFLMSSSDVSIYNGVFRLLNENNETAKVLEFKDLNINATNFLINGSDVSARINTLNFKDSRGVVVKNLTTNFSYTLTNMTFANLDIKTPNSRLKGDLKFDYLREDLQYFTDKVSVTASFNDSSVLLDELNTFYDEFGKGQEALFSVDLSGTLNDLQTKNLRLTTSRNSRIYGNINFKNLFSKEDDDFYMNANLSNLTSTYGDLKGLLPNILGESIPSSFERLGKFTIIGNSQVTTSTVIADVIIDTELGLVNSDLKITTINDIDNASYKGKVIFEKFDFGTFLESPKIGEASLNFDVQGKGFITETINTQVKGDVYEVLYNNYNYKGIKVAGNVRNKIFDGNFISTDDNLKMNFLGLVDFSENISKYDFEANVGYANLNVLNFVKKDSISIFRSRVKMNMNASSYDDAYGRVVFENTSYKNQNDTYTFDKFEIFSRFENSTRYIGINSPDIVEGELKGRFKFRDLKKLFQNSLGHIYTNYEPHKVSSDQSIDFNFKIYNKIIEVFYPEIELGKNTFIRGRVESDENQFRLTFKSPEIKLLDYFVNNIELQVDNSNPLFNTYIEADSLNTKYYDVSKFSLINVTVNDTLFMRTEFQGGKRNKDIFNLSFYHTINEENKSVVGFKKSDFTVKDYTWYINENNDRNNKLSFDKDISAFDIDRFVVSHGNEEVRLSGFVKDSTQKDIKLNFDNVSLAKIIPDIDSLALEGRVNGKLDILQQNGSYLPNSTIVINDFRVNKFDLGSFDASITGNENLTNYNVNIAIKDDEKKSFRAIGDINVLGKASSIDVDLEFNAFNLQPLNPLLQDVLSNIRGLATGVVKVEGNLNKPDINGDMVLNDAGLGVPYLNVDYDFAQNSSVSLKDQTFFFNKIQLTDSKYKSKGQLNGAVSHVNFSKWNLDLDIRTPNLLVLDTPETEDALYYGTGFMGGYATLKGPTEQLVVSVLGETKPGTVFKIPLSDTESFGDNTYIHFLTKEEKDARRSGKEIVFNEIEGLELDFDLDVTEDAELEIIIDKDSGHSLKGRGRGGLLVEINTNGKFNMWGDFSVFEGVYNFAYGGLIQKQFIVQPGGTINWEGDPLDAELNMQAVLKEQTNPSPLLENPINRSIPVELYIDLKGELTQPTPEFSFKFPNVNSTIKSELQYSLESPDDRQNQALYLISTGSFSRGLNELNFSGTIADRLNGIINGIFSGGDGKVNIGLNYEAGANRPDYQTGDRFGVTLQTKITDRVLINGKVGVPVGGAGASETVIAGDVQIDFLLNEEGTLTATVFNRENSIRNFGEGIGYTQGIGASYSVDFDTFKELIRNLFKKSEKPDPVFNDTTQVIETSAIPEFIKMKTAKDQ